MYVKIGSTALKSSSNKGSVSTLANYLEKENNNKQLEEKRHFFNEKGIHSEMAVVNSIDSNVKGLKQKDAKFYMITINPSKDELKAIGDDDRALEKIASDTMKEYAKGFDRDGVTPENLLWFAKVEHDRKYSKDDEDVKNGTARINTSKPGDNRHIHIIVSRKTVDGALQISPETNFAKGSNTGAVKAGSTFSKVEFFKEANKTFDREFNYARQASFYKKFDDIIQKRDSKTNSAQEQYRDFVQDRGNSINSKKKQEAKGARSKDLNKEELKQTIKIALSGKPSLKEFLDRLEQPSTTAKLNVNAKGVSGISYLHKGAVYKGSQLGKDFGWNAINKELDPKESSQDQKRIAEAYNFKKAGEHIHFDKASSTKSGKTKNSNNSNEKEPKRKATGARAANPDKVALRKIIKEVSSDKPNLETFIKRLEKNQVKAVFSHNTKGISGISYKYNNKEFKGSQLGKGYSWNATVGKLDANESDSSRLKTAAAYNISKPTSLAGSKNQDSSFPHSTTGPKYAPDNKPGADFSDPNFLSKMFKETYGQDSEQTAPSRKRKKKKNIQQNHNL